jgi:hypothetical protein
MEAAEQLAASGQQQLTKAQLYWAAVEAAAAVMGQQQAAAANPRRDQKLLLLYWSTAVLSAADAAPSSSAASAVVAAMAADAAVGGDLTPRLLAAQELPAAVLGALLQAAQSTDAGSAVLPLLLSHALQTEQVQLLPADLVPQLLQSALAATVAPAAVLSFADCMQLLDLTLQQDRAAAVCAGTAELLLEAASSSTANRQQLKSLIQQHSGSPAVSVLLCSMLQAACKSGVTEHSWQLFRLLQQCSQPSQQQLQACSDLILHQKGITAGECTATAADRIVSVWQHCCAAAGSSSAAILQLCAAVQQAVASALIASRQSEQALQLAQDVPALLPYLASLWQQQQQVQQEGRLETVVWLQALQMCVAAGSRQAADAADTLTRLLLQQDASAGTWQDRDLPVELMKLLCSHGKAATALQLLPACLAATASEVAAATAIATAAGAVAESGDTQQQAELLQLLAGATQGVVQDALSQALGRPATAAVGLLLHALHDSSPEQGLGQLLTPKQLQQLSALVCSGAEHKGSSSSSSLKTLPTLRQLAEDCLSAHQLPGGVAAQLLNALCRQHTELQPTAAAGHLGVGGSPAYSSTERQGLAAAEEGDTAAVKQLVQLVADLCYSQTSSSSLPSNDFDAVEASFAEWASALSPDAAAAALFAAWMHRSQGSGPAVPLLCLELYQRAKPTGDSLVFDLGLLAAAEAAQHTSNWDRGGWCQELQLL